MADKSAAITPIHTPFELACSAVCGCAQEVAALRQIWEGYRQDGMTGRLHDEGMGATLLRLTYHLKRAKKLFPSVAQIIRALHNTPPEAVAGTSGVSYHDIVIALAETAVWNVATTAHLGCEILDVLSGPNISATELRSLLHSRREQVVAKFNFDRVSAPPGVWDSWKTALDKLPIINADALIALIQNEAARGAALVQPPKDDVASPLMGVDEGFRQAYAEMADTNLSILELKSPSTMISNDLCRSLGGSLHNLGHVEQGSDMFTYVLFWRGDSGDNTKWAKLASAAGAALKLDEVADIAVASSPLAIWAAVLFKHLEPFGFIQSTPEYRLLQTPCLASIRTCELILADRRKRRGQPPRIVFISSTSEDLKEHRAKVEAVVLNLGLMPRMQEHFGASGHKPLPLCLDKVSGTQTESSADVVVLIVAHRCGWIPENQPDADPKNISWLECEQARRNGKEVLAFVVEKNHPWPPDMIEIDQDKVDCLGRFMQWIDSSLVRETFTTPDSLASKVSAALHNWEKRYTSSVHANPDS